MNKLCSVLIIVVSLVFGGTQPVFATSVPPAFTMEWLAGKTLYAVWFGSGSDSGGAHIDNVAVVIKEDFGTDDVFTALGLHNSSDNVTAPYAVDGNGGLYIGGDSTSTNRIVCGSTLQYIKTAYEENGVLDNIDLYFFEESDALAYANNLSASIPSSQCSSTPNTPTLSSPNNGETNTSLTTTLSTRTFSDPDLGDTHIQTDWQLSNSSGFTTLIVSESSDTNLTTLTVPDGMLGESTTYYWRAQFYDLDGNASGWSNTFSFTTLSTNNPPNVPILASPTHGTTSVSLSTTLSTGSFSDPDNASTHLKTDWYVSDSSDFTSYILSQSSNTNLITLTVPDGMLNEGTTYYWKAQFYDQNSNASGWSSTYSFTTLTTNSDQNNNGVPDSQDVSPSVDIDSDGTADIQQDTIKSLNTVVGDAQLGISRKNDSTITDITKVESIDPDNISTVARPYSMPLGMFSLKLTVSPGSTVTPTIYFSEAAPASAIWVMYDNIKGWTDYSDYATFSIDRMSVVLQLQDGGYGDADGVANGIIVDPGGYGLATFLSGTVAGSTGSTITNAEITLTRALTGLSFALKSLSDGTFFSALLPGDYNYSVSASGYGSSSGSISIPETVVKSSLDISLNAVPILTTSINGSTASASWGAVANAEKYTFYYAPYPYEGEHTIVSLEMGSGRSISAVLPSGAAYYVAVTSWVNGVQSGYSNIELITMP